MATKVIMPKLGMAMSEGTVVKWLKEDGAEVQAGQPVVVVMSKKITYEVEATVGGILRHAAKPKDVRGIGQVVGFIAEPGEEIPPEEFEAAATAPGEAVEVQEEKEAAPAPAAKEPPAPKEERRVPSSPAARRLAEELGIDLSRVRAAGSRITEEDVQRHHEEQSRIVVSPLARRMAEEEGVDLATVKGTGPGGRITEEDVLRAMEKPGAPAAPPLQRIPFIGMRQAIAEQMSYSLQSMAQISMYTKADVTELKTTREALGVRWGSKPSYTDLLIKAVVVALQDHPLLGAKLEGDEIVLSSEYNIGVAVALDEGLIVPVVRNADQLSLPAIGEKLKGLAQRARDNTLDVDEVTGAAFTITNLGMFGIDGFTPIINPPEVAILGVGRIFQELAQINGQIVVRDMMTLSLTIDHRIVDGAPGAQFLQTLVRLLEHPALIFAGREG